MASGVIAHKFAEGLKVLNDAVPFAVGSRSLDKARDFARQYGMEKAYGSYEELADDPDVDIIYIATPHPYHYESAMLCLKAGKAVLCEKPFTMNAKETGRIINFAREKGLFLMEAMWTRFLPAIVKVREWLAEGLIGDVQFLEADFGFLFNGDPSGRLLNPALGGGALLDIGIYPVSFASMVFKSQPKTIRSLAHIGSTHVDEQFAALFGYQDGKMASLAGSLKADMANDALIMGTRGRIYIKDFFRASTALLQVDGMSPVQFGPELEGNGYNYEASEAMRLLTEGKKESEVMTLDDTLAVMQTMDAIRSQWGLYYPGESKD